MTRGRTFHLCGGTSTPQTWARAMSHIRQLPAADLEGTGYTPLELAEAHGHGECVRILRACEAMHVAAAALLAIAVLFFFH